MTAKSKNSSLHGILPALITPMNAQQDIDHEQLARFTEHLIRKGVHGLVPLGSTGEFYALTPAEREQTLKTVLTAARGRVPVVAGVNAGATREVVSYAQQAEKLGCAGVMVAAPFYSLPRPDELYAHFKAVNNAIGIPILLYNYPGRTGVDMTPDFIERLTALKNVRYVKESTGEMPRITELLRRCAGRLKVFCGCDTIALESLLVGAVGWVGGAANLLPASHVQLYQLTVTKTDLKAARKLFFEMLPTLELMEGGGKYTQFAKAGCGIMGYEAGAPRPPLAVPTKVELSALRAALKASAEGRAA
jgi:4-hydroxy-tetrahydrodipicolinate synthase